MAWISALGPNILITRLRAIHLIQVTSTGCGLAAVSPNQTFIPHWRRRHGLLNQSIEEFGPAAALKKVELERELVEVIIQMLARDSTLVGAQQPPHQQKRHTVHARQQDQAVLPLPLISLALCRYPSAFSPS